MSVRPLITGFSQRCRCGKNTAPGDHIQYNFQTRQVAACPACYVPVKPVSELVEYAHAGYRYAIQAGATSWVAVPLPGQNKAALRHAKRAAAAWLKAGGPGAATAPRTFKNPTAWLVSYVDEPECIFTTEEAAREWAGVKNKEEGNDYMRVLEMEVKS